MSGPEREQVAPYMAVGLSTVVHGIGSRRDIERNLRIVEDGIHAAVSIIGINMPVRLIALAEGALTGFTDEIFDIPHVTAARDLFIDIPAPETDRLAALGATVELDTFDGVQTVKIPEGSQPGARLRLRGMGVPRVQGSGRGDLYVHLDVHIPTKLTREQRRLFEELAALLPTSNEPNEKRILDRVKDYFL